MINAAMEDYGHKIASRPTKKTEMYVDTKK
jgi:hypothetical protein